jgi:hypothetical protein
MIVGYLDYTSLETLQADPYPLILKFYEPVKSISNSTLLKILTSS